MIAATFLLCPDRLPLSLRASVTHRDLAAGQFLYHRGDPAVSIHAVECGRLHLFSHSHEGRRVPLYVIRAGECVAEAALFADAYCGDVVAEVPSRVAIFPKNQLRQAFYEQPALSDEFMRLLTRRFDLLRIRLELRNLRSARERVLEYFRLTASPGQRTIVLDRPLKSVAEDLDLTHETFYRTLGQLTKEGAIFRQKRFIHLTGTDCLLPHGSRTKTVSDHRNSAALAVVK